MAAAGLDAAVWLRHATRALLIHVQYLPVHISTAVVTLIKVQQYTIA